MQWIPHHGCGHKQPFLDTVGHSLLLTETCASAASCMWHFLLQQQLTLTFIQAHFGYVCKAVSSCKVMPVSGSYSSTVQPIQSVTIPLKSFIVGLFVDDEFCDVASAKDNRELMDSGKNQLLSKDEINSLRVQGVTGEASHQCL